MEQLQAMSCEFEIIKKYFLPLTNGCKAANLLQDDCAIILPNLKKELVISKDLMVEDIHFKQADGAYNIAVKLLESNLSDLASSGAVPLYYMLGFSQKNLDENFIREFCRGLKDVSQKYEISLIGGDSTKTTDKLFFSLTIFGEVGKGKSLKRNNAKNKDLVFVSGNIGDAFLGLQILQNKITCSNKTHQKYLINHHLQPSARINLGAELAKQNLSKCAIDVSDGFLADLQHICKSSKLSAVIYQENIPLSSAAKFCLDENKNISLKQLLSGGDDYELIFTSSAKNKNKIEKLAEKIGVKVSCVGNLQKTKKEATIALLDQNNQPVNISQYGWQHY